MVENIVVLVLDESKWLSAAILLSLIAVLVLAVRQRRQSLSTRAKIIAAMNLFFGGMIGIMSFGHLLAVTFKFFQGTLEGSLGLLYALGLTLAIPAWWLTFETWRIVSFEQRERKKLVALNVWLGISLLALGFHNLPLAGPAALNIAYLFHSRRIVGWAIVSAAAAAMLALFIASLVFLASGQSFEQFKGM
ncbi:MAG: hypothetical protein DKINENOH_03722 [bacterium]|nr:hypothetical protein [bacterium]